MTRYLKLAGIAILALTMLAPAASARPLHFRVGGHFGPWFYGPTFYIGPGFYAPGWYGWYGAGVYGLGWYEPYGFVPAPDAGKVKIDTPMRDAQVYVDGGYAGTVGQLGKFPLLAGTHDIELRAPDGHTIYQGQIDVIAGKTVNIRA